MSDSKTLLSEDNVISLRSAYVSDDGNIVNFHLLPAFLDSENLEWVFSDRTYLYRHMRSPTEELKLMRGLPSVEQHLKPIKFETPPKLEFRWADSGNSVAVYLNGNPWAFIDEENHEGYSKGVLKPPAGSPAIANQWDQDLFEKLFLPD